MSVPLRIIAAILALLALGAGAYTAYRLQSAGPAAPDDIDATIFNAPRPIPGFALTDHNGEAFDPQRLQDHWTLLFFGFTHCPDVCPTTLNTLARSRALLSDLPASLQPEVVLISVDPERDTVEKLRDYVPFFDPTFIGVTGTTAEIDALTAALGVAHMKVPREDGDYTVDHSSAIFLIDPTGRQAALFSAPHEAASLAARYKATTSYLERR